VNRKNEDFLEMMKNGSRTYCRVMKMRNQRSMLSTSNVCIELMAAGSMNEKAFPKEF